MRWLLGILLLLSHFGTVYGSCTSSYNKDTLKVHSEQKMNNSKAHSLTSMNLKEEKNKKNEKEKSLYYDGVSFHDIVLHFSKAVSNYDNGNLEEAEIFALSAKKKCERLISNYDDGVLDFSVDGRVSFREYKAKVDTFYMDKFENRKMHKFSFSSIFDFLNPFSKDHKQ